MRNSNAISHATQTVHSNTGALHPEAPTIQEEILTDHDAADARVRELRQQVVAWLKVEIAEALRRHGFARLLVDFDGYGAEGQIQRVIAVRENGEECALPEATITFEWPEVNAVTVAKPQTEQAGERKFRLYGEKQGGSLSAAMEALCYALLWIAHSYWGDGEGAYGTFPIDAEDGSINLDFNERFVDTEYSNHVW
jgi:Family of unknown function (DUF6878)